MCGTMVYIQAQKKADIASAPYYNVLQDIKTRGC